MVSVIVPVASFGSVMVIVSLLLSSGGMLMSFSLICVVFIVSVLVFVSSVFVFIDVIVYVPEFSPIFSIASPSASVFTVYSLLFTLNRIYLFDSGCPLLSKNVAWKS